MNNKNRLKEGKKVINAKKIQKTKFNSSNKKSEEKG